MSSLRQRFARLEQAIQPGARFFVLHPDPDPTLGLDEQIAAYAAENGVTARDIIVFRPILARNCKPKVRWTRRREKPARRWVTPRTPQSTCASSARRELIHFRVHGDDREGGFRAAPLCLWLLLLAN
jgi:hypothetical protein